MYLIMIRSFTTTQKNKDIKYGPKLPIGKNGKKVQTYLSSIIDDHSRYILASTFYDNQEKEIVEEVVDRASRTIQSSTGETMKGLAGKRVKVRMSESVRRVLDHSYRYGLTVPITGAASPISNRTILFPSIFFVLVLGYKIPVIPLLSKYSASI